MKKIICVLLTILMLVLPFNAVFADELEVSGASFFDVPNNAWYKSSVDYCVSKGYFSGTSTNYFTPEGQLTREQFVTVLFNFAGYSKSLWSGETGFGDTTSGAWYSPYVKWARILGITSGVGNGNFGIGNAITREQFCTLLMNYAKSLGMNTSGRAYIYNNVDAKQVSSWAVDAMSWAVYSGIMTGTSSTTLSPKGITTRAQATMLFMKFDALVNISGVCKHVYTCSSLNDAKCTSSGTVTGYCSKCKTTKYFTISAIGHNIYNGICMTCGYYSYRPSPVGTYYLKGIDYDDGTYTSYVDYSVHVTYYSDGGFAFTGLGETIWGKWYFDEFDKFAYYDVYENGSYALRTCLEVAIDTIYIANDDGSWLYFQPY